MNSVILSGSSHTFLTKKIVKNLGSNLHPCVIEQFSNKEIRVIIQENIRSKNVFIVQTGCSIEGKSVNDYLIELLLIIDACKRSQANSITVIMPCYPYARADRKEESRVPIGAKVVADLLSSAGINRLVVMDLHASQIQGFFDIPVDNLYSLPVASKYLERFLFNDLTIVERQNKYIVVSPDAGAVKRTLKFGEKMNLNTIIIHKQRNYEKKNVVDKCMLISDNISIEGKTAIICDDMCDTGGTLIKCVELLLENGIKDVICLITHSILSGPAIERINSCEKIKRFIVTDSLPQRRHMRLCPKLEVITISRLLADVIKCMETGCSLGHLFR